MVIKNGEEHAQVRERRILGYHQSVEYLIFPSTYLVRSVQ